jgi:hypothetical protein
MIVLFTPTMFQLSCLQCIKQCVFGWFLKLMRDFSEDRRVPFTDQIHNRDDVERGEQSGIPGPDYVQLLEELFGSLCEAIQSKYLVVT